MALKRFWKVGDSNIMNEEYYEDLYSKLIGMGDDEWDYLDKKLNEVGNVINDVSIVELIGEENIEEFIDEWHKFHMDNLDAPTIEEFLENNRNVYNANADEYSNSRISE